RLIPIRVGRGARQVVANAALTSDRRAQQDFAVAGKSRRGRQHGNGRNCKKNLLHNFLPEFPAPRRRMTSQHPRPTTAAELGPFLRTPIARGASATSRRERRVDAAGAQSSKL